MASGGARRTYGVEPRADRGDSAQSSGGDSILRNRPAARITQIRGRLPRFKVPFPAYPSRLDA
jgi:hypothetical protein